MSLLKNEFANLFGIKLKAQKLSTTLELIKVVLKDAQKKQLTDRSIKIWLQQLKDTMYALDDILYECSIKSTRLKFCHDIESRLKKIAGRIDQIAESKNNFLLREGVTT